MCHYGPKDIEGRGQLASVSFILPLRRFQGVTWVVRLGWQISLPAKSSYSSCVLYTKSLGDFLKHIFNVPASSHIEFSIKASC